MAEATQTLVALYEADAAAERAAGRLVEAGVPGGAIERKRASEAEVEARKHDRSKLMAALFALEMPDRDRQSYERGMDRGGTLLVAHDVPADLRERALDIMDEDALDVEVETREEGPDHEGAVGTMGGSGLAMGDRDRLTGRRLGAADPPDAGPRKEVDTSHGSGEQEVGGDAPRRAGRRSRGYRRATG
jgi:hypothetical protein